VLQKCMPEQMVSPAWRERLAAMVPSYVQPVGDDATRCRAARARTSKILQLS